MRFFPFLSLALVSGCTMGPPVPSGEPALRVGYGDLALETAFGRASLRGRIEDVAHGYCRSNDRDVAPQLVHNKAGYCVELVRRALIAEMPDAVRRAYYRR
jgi:UrcA family protein